MEETPIYYVEWCQDGTPLTNLPPATNDIRFWKFIKHGSKGISIECNGAQVAHLEFEQSLKQECSNSKWRSSTVEYIKIHQTWDKTVAIRGN